MLRSVWQQWEVGGGELEGFAAGSRSPLPWFRRRRCRPEWNTVVETERKDINRLALKDPFGVRQGRPVESCNSMASAPRWSASNFNLALPSCVGLGKSLHFSESLFPHLKNRDDNGTSLLVLG